MARRGVRWFFGAGIAIVVVGSITVTPAGAGEGCGVLEQGCAIETVDVTDGLGDAVDDPTSTVGDVVETTTTTIDDVLGTGDEPGGGGGGGGGDGSGGPGGDGSDRGDRETTAADAAFGSRSTPPSEAHDRSATFRPPLPPNALGEGGSTFGGTTIVRGAATVAASMLVLVALAIAFVMGQHLLDRRDPQLDPRLLEPDEVRFT